MDDDQDTLRTARGIMMSLGLGLFLWCAGAGLLWWYVWLLDSSTK